MKDCLFCAGLVVLAGLGVSGCIASASLVTEARNALTDPFVSADDAQFREYCSRYGGTVREFEPVKADGIRYYQYGELNDEFAFCGQFCRNLLEEGYAFVEMHVYEYGASPGAPFDVFRFVADPLTGEPKTVDRKGQAPAPVEQVYLNTQARNKDAFATRTGARNIQVEGRFAGELQGFFDGVRRIEDGALYGQGKFTLYVGASLDSRYIRGEKVASCP